MFAEVVVAGGNSSVLCRGSHWEQFSVTVDFLPPNDTSADVGLALWVFGQKMVFPCVG